MEQQRFWNLLAKKFSKEACPAELAELEELMRNNPDWMYQAQHLMNIWSLKKEEDLLEAENAFKKHTERLHEEKVDFPVFPNDPDNTKSSGLLSKNKIRWVAVAALFFVFAITGWYYTQNRSHDSAKRISRIQTKLASKTKMVMPDSSVVWLNAGSTLTYDEDFGGSNRNVSLNGEAYFDVKKSSIPFIISTHLIKVKVLGTSFNIKAYSNETTTETSLIRGQVEVSINQNPGKIFFLSPNEKLVVTDEEPVQTKNAEETKQKISVTTLGKVSKWQDKFVMETSWVDNKLVFDDEAFEEVAVRMERWYDVVINFSDEELKTIRLTGNFEGETITQALEALQITRNFNYTINGNQINISK